MNSRLLQLISDSIAVGPNFALNFASDVNCIRYFSRILSLLTFNRILMRSMEEYVVRDHPYITSAKVDGVRK